MRATPLILVALLLPVALADDGDDREHLMRGEDAYDPDSLVEHHSWQAGRLVVETLRAEDALQRHLDVVAGFGVPLGSSASTTDWPAVGELLIEEFAWNDRSPGCPTIEPREREAVQDLLRDAGAEGPDYGIGQSSVSQGATSDRGTLTSQVIIRVPGGEPEIGNIAYTHLDLAFGGVILEHQCTVMFRTTFHTTLVDGTATPASDMTS